MNAELPLLFRHLVAACLLPATLADAAAESRWLHLHPGGGGQIQGISADPNVPGRLYTCSDVEGMYRSDDWGLSWRSIGRGLIHHMVFYVAVDPHDSRTLYAGTLYGLSKSADGGASWTTLAGGYASASFDFDPFARDRFIAGRSWYIKDSQLRSQTSQPDQQTEGPRFILLSEDGGRTFQRVVYEPAEGYAQCYSVTFDPVRRGHVYLGAFSGLYRAEDGGRNFRRLAGPAGPGVAAGCSGATLTPDGRFVLATFGPVAGSRFQGGTRLYAAAADRIDGPDAWRELSDGLFFPPGGGNQYWNPKVDPRSRRTDYGLGGTYKVLLAFLNGPVGPLADRQGLHEGTFTVGPDGQLVGRFERIFGRPSVSPEYTFDLGWNEIGPQNRQNCYLPLSWDAVEPPPHLSALGGARSRKAYVTNNQQLYLGNAADPRRSWVVLSNRYVRSLNGHRFYRAPGFASTVNYDMDAHGDYWVQGMADNGLLESYDNGESWSQRSATGSPAAMANGDAVLALAPRTAGEAPLFLAGTAPGFGGGSHAATGVLRAKRLTEPDGSTAAPSQWRAIAGGPGGSGGLGGGPNGGPRIWYLAAHPADNNHVFAGTHVGLFHSADIRALAEGRGGEFGRIPGVEGSFSFGRIHVDPRSPVDAPVLYLKCVAGAAGAVRTASVAGGVDAPGAGGALLREGEVRSPAQGRGGRKGGAGANRPLPVATPDDSGGDESEGGGGRDQLLRLSRRGGAWEVERLATPNPLGQGDDFAYWRRKDGHEFMAYTDRQADVHLRERAFGAAEWTPWRRILSQDAILRAWRAPWWDWRGWTPEGGVQTRMRLTLMGLVGHSDSLQVGSYAAFGKHGYMMLRGVRGGDGSWQWADWTGEESDPHNFMTVPRVWRARLIEPRPGEFYYAAASRGGGLIVRRLPDE
jgi:hypothetical protein